MTPSDNGNGARTPDDRPRGVGEVMVPQRVQLMAPSGFGLPPAKDPSQVPHALELLKALRRRWRIAIPLGIVCAAIAAGIVWAVVPPAKYTAQARLHVASVPPRIIFKTDNTSRYADFGTYQRTQLAWIKSRLVLNSALRQIANQPPVARRVDPIAWLERELQIGFDGEILHIALSDSEPDGLAEVVNAIKDAYLSEVVEEDERERRQRKDKLEGIYDQYQEDLEQRRATLRKLGRDLGTTKDELAQVTHEMTLERLHVVQRELWEIRSRLQQAEIDRRLLLDRVPTGGMGGIDAVPRSLVDQRVRDDPRYQEVEEGVRDLERQFRSHDRRIRKSNDPVLRNLLGQIEAAKRYRHALWRQLYAKYLDQLAEGGGDSGAFQREMGREISAMELRRDQLLEEVEEITEESKTNSDQYMDLGVIKADIAKMEKTSDEVGAELEALKVELDAPDRVKEIERANDPRLEKDKRLKMAGMGGAGTFALVLLGIAWVEHRSRRIDSPGEVADRLGLTVMGSLPLRGRRPRGQHRSDGPKASPSDHVLIESIDAARTHLLHTTRCHAIRSLMVTSAVAGEGKTSLACHLAASIARTGRTTLLIDCDLRKPSLHELFDQPPTPGFSELLRGLAGVEEVIRPTPAEGLWMIPAGQWDRRAVEALTRDEARTLFDHLKDRFDYVVVDTSPILPVTDALLLGQHLDAALCSILRGVSRTPRVLAAQERLQTLGIQVLGAVVAGVHNEVYRSGYYQYQEVAGGRR